MYICMYIYVCVCILHICAPPATAHQPTIFVRILHLLMFLLKLVAMNNLL